jgi:hypothetical protein
VNIRIEVIAQLDFTPRGKQLDKLAERRRVRLDRRGGL